MMSWWLWLAGTYDLAMLVIAAQYVYRGWRRRRERRAWGIEDAARKADRRPPPRVTWHWCPGCDRTHPKRRMEWTNDGAYLCTDCRRPPPPDPVLGFSPVDVTAQLAGDWTRPVGFDADDTFDDALMCHGRDEPIARHRGTLGA
jgi:hypothetical protein